MTNISLIYLKYFEVLNCYTNYLSSTCHKVSLSIEFKFQIWAGAKNLKEVDTTEWLIISSFKYKFKKIVCLFVLRIHWHRMNVFYSSDGVSHSEYHIQPGPFPATKKHKSFPAERSPACFCQNIVTWSPGPFHYPLPSVTA